MNPSATTIRKVFIICLAVFFPVMTRADEAVAGSLVVTDAWVQEAPPAARVHAAYMHLANTGNDTLQVTDVSAEHYAMAMIHKSSEKGGMMTMEHLDALSIPPHSVVELAPGDMHIMLMKPDHVPKAGDKVRITLQLERGASQVVEAIVRAAP